MIALLLALPLAAPAVQDAPVGAVELREEPSPGRKPPVLLCAGASAGPDGTVLRVELFLDSPGGRVPVARGLVRVRERRFSFVFEPFKGRERNLPGVWIAQATYDPFLQPGDPPFPDKSAAEGVLRLGEPEVIRQARREIADRLLAELRLFAAGADEVLQARQADRAKADPARWDPLRESLRKRFLDLRNRGVLDPEIQALGLLRVPDHGMHEARDYVLEIVELARRGEDVAMVQARERLDRELAKMADFIGLQTTEVSQGRLLARGARESLQTAAGLPAEARGAAKRRFLESVLQLGRHLPPTEAGSVAELSSGGLAYFEALESGAGDPARLWEDLDRRLRELHERLPK
jgi:hypothetical protein